MNAELSITALLASLPLFTSLDAAELERIARGTREVRARKGESLFQRGDPCHGFHLIISGQVKLSFTSAAGNEKVIDLLGPGQTFGEAVMFQDRPYFVQATALQESHLLLVSKTTVFEELERDAVFCRKIIASLSQRLHRLVGDVEAYSLRSGRERVIGFLLRDENYDEDEPALTGNVSLRLPANKGVIASRLNLTQEHFSRILHELQDKNLIRVEGRIIHIPDIERLRQNQG